MRYDLILTGFLLSGCLTGPEAQSCAAEYAGSICLDLDAAGSLAAHRATIESEVERGLAAIQPLLHVEGLRVAVIADPTQVIPEIGMGGFNPGTGEVRLYVDPARSDLETVLRTHLVPQLAHEVHHAMRRRAIGYGATLLAAAISEGLADHFALEVTADPAPPWATALSPTELATWLPQVVAGSTGSYNHPDWFVGTNPSIPRWTGYTVGFELVRAYLAQDTTRRPSVLVGEPAASFVPYTP